MGNTRGLCVAVILSEILVFAQKNGLFLKEVAKSTHLAKLTHINVINSAASEFTTFGDLCGKPLALGSSENDEFSGAGFIFEGVGTMGMMANWTSNCISRKSVSNTAL